MINLFFLLSYQYEKSAEAGGFKYWKVARRFISESASMKPFVSRETKTGAKSTNYVNFGHRKEPKYS